MVSGGTRRSFMVPWAVTEDKEGVRLRPDLGRSYNVWVWGVSFVCFQIWICVYVVLQYVILE